MKYKISFFYYLSRTGLLSWIGLFIIFFSMEYFFIGKVENIPKILFVTFVYSFILSLIFVQVARQLNYFEVNSDGIFIRTLFNRDFFAWKDIDQISSNSKRKISLFALSKKRFLYFPIVNPDHLISSLDSISHSPQAKKIRDAVREKCAAK